MKRRYTAKELAELSYRDWLEVMKRGSKRLRMRALVAHLASGAAAEAATMTGGPVEVTMVITWPGGKVEMTAGLENIEGEIRMTERSRWVAENTGEIFEEEPEVT